MSLIKHTSPTSLAELAETVAAHLVYAGPASGAAALSGWRQLAILDIDGLQTSLDAKAADADTVKLSGSYADPAHIASLAGSKVSGDIAGNAANVTGTVAAANGGTGRTSLTVDRILIGNGTGPVKEGAIGTGLAWDGTTLTATGGGGSGTPAGSDTQIQYNAGGAFGASANFVYDGTNLILTGPATDTKASIRLSNTVTGTNSLPSDVRISSYSLYNVEYVEFLAGTANGANRPIAAVFTPAGNPTGSAYVLQLYTGTAAGRPYLLMAGDAGNSKHVIAGSNENGGNWSIVFKNPAGANWSTGTDLLAIAATGAVVTVRSDSDRPTLALRPASGQTTPLLSLLNASGSQVGGIRADSSWQPPTLADASAANTSVYHSSTLGKLAYKTSGGVVQSLVEPAERRFTFGAIGTPAAGDVTPRSRVSAAASAFLLEAVAEAGTFTADIERSTDGAAWTVLDSISLATGDVATKTVAATLAAGDRLRARFTAVSGVTDPSVILHARNS